MVSIWKYYEKIPEKQGSARCLLCKKEYSYKTTTTNLKKHLMFKHSSTYHNFMNQSMAKEEITENSNITDSSIASNFNVNERDSSPEIELEHILVHDYDDNRSNEGSTGDSNEIIEDANVKKNPRNRILIKNYDNLLPKIEKPKKNNCANAAKKPVVQSENEFDIFGKSVAAQLKNMPLDIAIESQRFLQNYLSNKRLKALHDTTYYESTQ